ncbi:transposase [Streptomyces sp. TLI_55]|uniref:transposase n=1 Tax=Streptomyces sp. TLI_55 TaxID=1938861 RepID=UPI000BE279D9
MLPDRDTATVAAWLRQHPGAQIICRGRSMMFTKAVHQAAPQAQEAADRWHLPENLSSAVEKTCRQHRDCRRAHAARHLPPRPGAVRSGRSGTRAHGVPHEGCACRR